RGLAREALLARPPGARDLPLGPHDLAPALVVVEVHRLALSRVVGHVLVGVSPALGGGLALEAGGHGPVPGAVPVRVALVVLAAEGRVALLRGPLGEVSRAL